jgi:hypothetical protein
VGEGRATEEQWGENLKRERGTGVGWSRVDGGEEGEKGMLIGGTLEERGAGL